jgi:hypothetical protein
MKRKQSSISAFFQVSKSNDEKGSDGDVAVVDLTADDHVVDSASASDNARCQRPFLASPLELSPQTNAFNRLLSASRLKSRVKAVFSLTLDESGRLLPSFVFGTEEPVMPTPLSPFSSTPSTALLSSWRGESHVRPFRWNATSNEHRELSVLLVTNMPSHCEDHLAANSLKNNPKSFSQQHNTQKIGQQQTQAIMAASMAKSMIQKSVRRRQCFKSIKLANHLAEVDLLDLLRRLPVISLEDSILHPGLPIVVWMMMAMSKGYQPPSFVRNLCALIMGDLSCTEWRDCQPPTSLVDISPLSVSRSSGDSSSSSSRKNHNNTSDESESACMLTSLPSNASQTLVASILLRRAFGGMIGDMELLEDFAVLWTHRLQGLHTIRTPISGKLQEKSLAHTILNMQYLNELCRSGSLCPNSGFRTWGHQLLSGFEHYPNHLLEFFETSYDHAINMQHATNHAMRLWLQLKSDASPQLLALTAEDLSIEGIDNQCDWTIMDVLMDKCALDIQELLSSNSNELCTREIIVEKIQQSIWFFRSSLNVHKLWKVQPCELAKHEASVDHQLHAKESLRGVWRIVCPHVNTYCTAKLQTIVAKLQRRS